MFVRCVNFQIELNVVYINWYDFISVIRSPFCPLIPTRTLDEIKSNKKKIEHFKAIRQQSDKRHPSRHAPFSRFYCLTPERG